MIAISLFTRFGIYNGHCCYLIFCYYFNLLYWSGIERRLRLFESNAISNLLNQSIQLGFFFISCSLRSYRNYISLFNLWLLFLKIVGFSFFNVFDWLLLVHDFLLGFLFLSIANSAFVRRYLTFSIAQRFNNINQEYIFIWKAGIMFFDFFYDFDVGQMC